MHLLNKMWSLASDAPTVPEIYGGQTPYNNSSRVKNSVHWRINFNISINKVRIDFLKQKKSENDWPLWQRACPSMSYHLITMTAFRPVNGACQLFSGTHGFLPEYSS